MLARGNQIPRLGNQPGLDLLCVLGRGLVRYGARRGAAASV